MKKLMIALAAVAMAVSANAAVAKWTVSNVRTPEATDKTLAETGIVPPNTAAFLEGLAIDLYYNGEKITDGTTNSNGMKMQGQFWTQQQAIDATTAAGSNTLTFDIAATYTAAEGTYVYAGSMSANLANVVSGSKDVGVTFNAGTAGSWSFTPAPEPTSGLLLLIGVACLALRRRRA